MRKLSKFLTTAIVLFAVSVTAGGCSENNKIGTWFDQVLCAHEYDDGKVTVEATCTEKGTWTYTCNACGKEKKEVIAPLGHTEVTDAAVAATCTTEGLTGGNYCSVCDEVLVAQEVIPATGHVDANADFLCDVCGCADTANATEVDVAVGEKVAGNWYRLYRSARNMDSATAYGFVVTGDVVSNVGSITTIPFAILGKDEYAAGNENSFKYIYYSLVDQYYTLDDNYIVTEEYIDFYVEEGASIHFYKEYNGNPVIDVTITITAESVIESIGSKANVKRLVTTTAE